MVQSFLKCSYVDLNEGDEHDQTPLYLASKQNHSNIVEILLADSRTNVNMDVNSEHALLAATQEQNTDIVQLLLIDKEIDVNKINSISNKTALMIAAESGFLGIVQLLLSHPQTFVNNIDANFETALQKAICKGHLEVLKLLLRCTKTTIPKDTSNFPEIVLEEIQRRNELLERGPTCCLNLKSVIFSSAINGDYRALRGLLKCPDANINTVDDRGRTPIYLASWKGHRASVEVLLGNSNLNVN